MIVNPKMKGFKVSEKIRGFVRQAIRDSGLTQEDVAQRCDMTQPQISKYLRGESDIRASTLHRLLLALGKDLKMVKKQLEK